MANEFTIQLLKAGSLVIFPVFVLFFAILSVILNYHWTRYGIEPKKIRKIKQLYFGMSLAFIFAMVISFIFMLTL